jgi:hypothetical protein
MGGMQTRGLVATLTLIAVVVGGSDLRPASSPTETDADAVPSLKTHAGAATSAEQIAERLRSNTVGNSATGVSPSVATEPLMATCPRTMPPSAPLPPQGVPAYGALVRVPGLDEPLEVRFWLTTPVQAKKIVAASRQAANACAGHHPDGGSGDGAQETSDTTVSSYARQGWTGVQRLAAGVHGRDTDPSDTLIPFTEARAVAARGMLLAEVRWDIEGRRGANPMAKWRGIGETAAEQVLTAVGGDPARRAPERPDPQRP